jgi:hypothetical protein
MSVIVDATYAGEAFEVEVFHNGHIEFPGRNLQHEQAMAEFTDSESAVMKLYDMWKESPTKVIFENLELPENSVPRLAADYAEHVQHLYEREYEKDRRIRDVIEATRKFVAGEIDELALEKARAAALAAEVAAEAAWVAALAAGGWAAVETAARAAASTSARAAVWAAVMAAGVGVAEHAVASTSARAAAWAAAYSVSSDDYSPKWHRAFDIERAWQIRRFVDAMEAIGQGFDWPDIKVTP